MGIFESAVRVPDGEDYVFGCYGRDEGGHIAKLGGGCHHGYVWEVFGAIALFNIGEGVRLEEDVGVVDAVLSGGEERSFDMCAEACTGNKSPKDAAHDAAERVKRFYSA